MASLRPLKLREVLRALARLGFDMTRQSGSHAIFRHPDGRRTVVPIHSGDEIGRGLLRTIIAECKVSVEEFLGEKKK